MADITIVRFADGFRVLRDDGSVQVLDLDKNPIGVDVQTPDESEFVTGIIAQTNRTSIEQRATHALASNEAFLSLASPTNAQTLAQVRALTRQNNALIRLALDRFDTDSGT